MDPGTISAIVALVIALLALFVAFAQVVQQYMATADLMRKCDSIVFGPLPGKGHRVWVMRQLRFKVIYEMPQLSLHAGLWPSNAPFTGSNSQATSLLPNLAAANIKFSSPGEASWASFCRVMQNSCHESMRYRLVPGDADRCPSDIPVIPMQISLRDVIVMAMMAGMRISSAETRFHPTIQSIRADPGRISMQGQAGTITTADHPILGLIVHFTPFNIGRKFGITHTPSISTDWMSRLWGQCPIGTVKLGERKRRHIEAAELVKYEEIQKILNPTVERRGFSQRRESSNILHDEKSPRKPTLDILDASKGKNAAVNKQPDTTNASSASRPAMRSPLISDNLGINKGDSQNSDAVPQGSEGKQDSKAEIQSEVSNQPVTAKELRQRIYFKDAVGRKFSFPFHLAKTWSGMKMLIDSAMEHIEVIGPHVFEGHYDLVGPDGSIILPQVWEAIIEPGWKITMLMWPIPEPLDITQTPAPPLHWIPSRLNNSENDGDISAVSFKETISWFWICQMNIIPGYWATPWAVQFSSEYAGPDKISIDSCFGGLAVALQTLSSFTTPTSFQYISKYPDEILRAFYSNTFSCPPFISDQLYKNVVIKSGLNDLVTFQTSDTKISLFETPIPPLRLLHSYSYQVKRYPGNDDETIIEKQLELAVLDSWLSITSSTPEIQDYRLVVHTPAIIQKLLMLFEEDFRQLDRTALEGGLEEINKLKEKLLQALKDERLLEPQQLFIVIALIRAIKVALCIAFGPSTAGIQERLREDMPVYLV